jgi:hypothetical protein
MIGEEVTRAGFGVTWNGSPRIFIPAIDWKRR